MTLENYAIGTTYGGLTNLANLTTPVNYPKSHPLPYAETKTLGDYTERGIGAPNTVWHWAVLTQAMRDQLRTFCPGASASVYITTRSLENDGLFRTYTAIMVWPSQSEEYDAKHRTGFDIIFRGMVVYTP